MVTLEPGQIWFPNDDISVMKNVSQLVIYGRNKNHFPRQISHTFEWKDTVWVVYHEFFDKDHTHTDTLVNFEKWVQDTKATNVLAENDLLAKYTKEHQKHIIVVHSNTDIGHEMAAWIIENVGSKWSFNTRSKQDSRTGSLTYCFEASFEDLQTATLFRLRF